MIKLSDGELKTLGSSSWTTPKALDEMKSKLKSVTLRDLFMKLGAVTLSYKVPGSNLVQDISVSTYQATVNQTSIHFENCGVKTTDTKTGRTFNAYLASENTTK